MNELYEGYGDADQLLELTEEEFSAEVAAAYRKGRDRGRADARAEFLSHARFYSALNGDGAKFQKALEALTEPQLKGFDPNEKRDAQGRWQAEHAEHADNEGYFRPPAGAESARIGVTWRRSSGGHAVSWVEPYHPSRYEERHGKWVWKLRGQPVSRDYDSRESAEAEHGQLVDYSDIVGKPLSGEQLHQLGLPGGTPPAGADWRPDEMLPEDHYAKAQASAHLHAIGQKFEGKNGHWFVIDDSGHAIPTASPDSESHTDHTSTAREDEPVAHEGRDAQDGSHRNPQTRLVDRARVGVPAMSVPPPPASIPPLPNLSRKQRKVEQRYAEAYLADPDRMARKYLKALRKRKVGVEPNVFATDDVKALNPDWNPGAVRPGEKLDKETKTAMAKYNTVIHQVANAIAKRAFLRYLDETVKALPLDRRTVLVTNGGCAAGKGSSLARAEDSDSPYHGILPAAQQVGAVWDAAGEQNATENEWVLQECRKRGIKPIFAYVYADPKTTWEAPDRGVIRRAARKGRMVDARLFADSYAEGARNMHEFHEKHKDDGTQFIFIDNRKKGDPKLMDGVPLEARQWDAEEIYADAVRSLHAHAGDLPEPLVEAGLAGQTIWGPPKLTGKKAMRPQSPDPDEQPERMPPSPLEHSLLAGLAQEGDDPDAVDEAFDRRLSGIGPEDLLLPPGGGRADARAEFLSHARFYAALNGDGAKFTKAIEALTGVSDQWPEDRIAKAQAPPELDPVPGDDDQDGDDSPDDTDVYTPDVERKGFNPNEPRDEKGEWTKDGGQGPAGKIPPDFARRKRAGLRLIPIAKIDFVEQWDSGIAPLKENHKRPIIVYPTSNGRFRLIDGFGRTSGMRNAGNTSIYAISVAESDLKKNSGGDKPNDDGHWVGAVHAKYAPDSAMAYSESDQRRQAQAKEQGEQQKYRLLDSMNGFDLQSAAYHHGVKIESGELYPLVKGDPELVQKYRNRIRRVMVEGDINAGKPIPSELLRLYPDLEMRNAERHQKTTLVKSLNTAPMPEVELLLHAVEYARDCAHDGTDAQPVLDAIAQLAHDPYQLRQVLDGTHVKAVAWDESKHPRAKNGRFISIDRIHAAKNDPKLAKQLRKEVKPEDAGKLEDALAGKTDIGHTARSKKRAEAQERREKKIADRDQARVIRDRLFAQYQQGLPLHADDLRALIPHLGTMTHAELTNVRVFLHGAGAGFGGATKLQERRDRLIAWAKGEAEPKPKPTSEPVASEPLTAPTPPPPPAADTGSATPRADAGTPAIEANANKTASDLPKQAQRVNNETANGRAIAPASPPQSKPTKKPRAKKPSTDRERLVQFAASAPTPEARDAMETALHNMIGDHKELTAEARRRNTLDRLAAVWRDTSNAGDTATANHIANVLEQFGGKKHGPAPSETVPFDGRYYESSHSVFTGDPAKVERQPIVRTDERNNHYVAVKGAVSPVEAGGWEPAAPAPTAQERKPKARMAKVTVPSKMPRSITQTTHKSLKDNLKAKFVPPAPKVGEIPLVVERPQAGPQYFQEYQKGDLIYSPGSSVAGVKREWMTDTVNDLLWRIKTEGNNEAMPILADALQDAGCDNEELLTSLRAKESKGWISKLIGTVPQYYVATAVKPGFTRGGEGFKRWEQAINVRRATADELASYHLHDRAATIRHQLTGGVNEIIPVNADELRRELAEIEAKINA